MDSLDDSVASRVLAYSPMLSLACRHFGAKPIRLRHGISDVLDVVGVLCDVDLDGPNVPKPTGAAKNSERNMNEFPPELTKRHWRVAGPEQKPRIMLETKQSNSRKRAGPGKTRFRIHLRGIGCLG